MASLWKSKEVISRPKPDGRCKKHPKHRQSPGVCSVCLSEKLSQLSSATNSRSTSTNTMDCSSSSSLSSYYSSSSCSSYSSPVHRFRYPTQGKGSFPLFSNGKNMLLTKSRSLAFVARRRDKDSHEKGKKGGFWSKFLRRPKPRKEEDGGLMASEIQSYVPSIHKKDGGLMAHSKTMRERVIITTRVN